MIQKQKQQNNTELKKKIAYYKNYIAGGFAGIACALVGQPFDTIKVRLQASNKKKSMFNVINNLVKNEGLSGFYKGVSSPLVVITIIDSLRFGSQSHIDNYLKQKNKEVQSDYQKILNFTIAGSIGGFMTGFITSPMEQIRIKMQLMTISNKNYSTTWQCIKYIQTQYGLKGLFRGLPICLLRDTICYFVYFGTYKILSLNAQKYFGIKEKSENMTAFEKQKKTISTLACGSIAGIFLWLSVYPIDTIKSNIQGDSMQNPKYNGTLSVIKSHTFSQLWRGIFPCLLRAIPTNASVFFAYETTKQYIENFTKIY